METDKLLMDYVMKFGELPPLPYSYDYDDEPIVKAIKNAIATGNKLIMDDYPEDINEGVITS